VSATPEVTFNGQCPFCGEMIDDTDIDSCRLSVETRTGKWQVWFCHAHCFKTKIVANPYMDLSPTHF